LKKASSTSRFVTQAAEGDPPMSNPTRPQQHSLDGRVLRPDGTPFAANGATVRALHQLSSGQPILLGQATLRADGSYAMTYLFPPDGAASTSSGPNLLVQLLSAEGTVLASALRPNAKLVESVELRLDRTEPGGPESRLLVRGQVTDAQGGPLADLIVRAFDRDMRSEELLGETQTDIQGRYVIAYSADQFARAEKRSADLRVSLCNAAGLELVSSPIHFNAQPIEHIDLITDDKQNLGPSEYERLVEILKPLVQGVPFAELTDADIEFLEGETEIAGLHILYLALAQQAIQTISVPEAAFYGLFRQELPTNLPALLLLAPRILREALERALAANLVPADLREQLDRIVTTLQDQGAQYLLATTDASGRDNARQILELAGLPADLQAVFLKTYLSHEGPTETLWQELRQNPAYAAHIDSLQGTLQLALAAQNNAPLVRVLQTRGKVRSLRELAALDVNEVNALISASPEALTAIPKQDETETDQQKSERVARDLYGLANAAFPTASLLARVQKEPTPGNPAVGADAMQLLNNLPELELRDDHVDRFLAKQGGGAFAGVIDKATAIAELKTMQRVLRIAPVAEHAETLLRDGLHSARDITTLSAASFVESYAARLGGPAQARMYYNKALETRAASTLVFSAVHQSVHAASPAVVPQPKPDPTLLPNLTSLFGSQSFCACAHCRSVYSPAAYLVDLLQFLRPKVVAGKQLPALDVLLKRRPDLAHIPLTCDNTNLPLPYTDLVAEILEYFVVHNKLDADAARTTEQITAEELSVNSQYTLTAAYTPLLEVVYPPSLPYDRPLERVRTYLEHLGSSRSEVMTTFQTANSPDAVAIACATLRISARERAILTGADLNPPKSLPEFYGFSSQPNWIQQLGQVQLLLTRTAMSYAELSDLLETRFLNRDHALVLIEQPDADPCDLENIALSGLTEAILGRLHRFIRLWRKLGWSIGDLDKVLASLQASEIDDTLLEQLAQIKQLQAILGQKQLLPLLSLWSNIDSYGEASLYARLFLNKAVLNPIDSAFTLDEQASELLNAEAPLADHVPTVLAALRLSAANLDVLRAASGLDDQPAAQPPVVAQLNLASLSALYRLAVLARALKLPFEDLVALQTLIGIDPFQPATPAAALSFVEQTRKLRQSGFTVAELNYLYRHLDNSDRPIAPTATELKRLRVEIQAGLRRILAETTVTELNGELLRRTFQQLLGIKPDGSLSDVPVDPLVARALALVEGSSSEDEAARTLFIETQFAAFADVDAAKTLLLPALSDEPETRAEQQQARLAFVCEHGLAYLRDFQSRSLIKQILSTALNLEPALLVVLLEGRPPQQAALRAQSDPNQPAITDLLDLQVAETDATDQAPLTEHEQRAHRLLQRLFKVALLVDGLQLTADEVAYFSNHAADFADFDLNLLPLETSAFIPSLLTAWQRLCDYRALRESLSVADQSLLDVFATAAASQTPESPSEELVTLVLAVTGWDGVAFKALAGAAPGFNLSDANFRDERWLRRLQDCLALSKRLGVAAEKLLAWATSEPDELQASEVVGAVKAKYEDEQWLAVGKALNDPLRDRQRETLVAYLLTLPSLQAAAGQAGLTIQAASDLLDYFLIDVEMTSCMATSRIKQAISSVQLFVQRCLMNLEPEVTPTQINVERWEWMQNYRVWEANRKVFLYPENWIEPELRDNKSPFFRELEAQLLQNDINAETVEQAFLDYLEKLDEVARLEVCGIYTQTETEAGEQSQIVHVFGRTRETPHIYYYRQRARGVWTAWEKIPADIEGNHLIPVVYNRRLYLFWPHFEQKPDDNQVLGAPYIESLEHYKWRTEEIPAWQQAQKDYENRKAGYELAQAHRATLKDVLHLDDPAINTILEQLGLLEYTEMPVQPAQPQEPSLSTPPALEHWEISLAWSEYRYGRWSAKQTSQQFVTSPNDQQPFFDLTASVYLPQREEHFFKIAFDVSGSEQFTDPLMILVQRRYSHQYSVLGGPIISIDRYELVGSFLVGCGAKISAQDFLSENGFDWLVRPNQMTNLEQGFVGQDDFAQLAFTSGNQQRVVLQTTDGQGQVLLQPDARHYEFALKPPYQIFAYQDDLKTYFVSPIVDSPPQTLQRPDQAVIRVPFEPEHQRASHWKARLTEKIVRNGRGPQQMIAAAAASRSTTENKRAQATSPTALQFRQAEMKTSAQNIAKNYTMATMNTSIELAASLLPRPYLHFSTYFHPFLCEFLQHLYRDGVTGLLAFSTQQLNNDRTNPANNVFNGRYAPTELVHWDRPREEVDFGNGAYALYNWELFFHTPMLVAVALGKNQRFEEALRWFHFVFNPTTDQSGGVERYWNTLPFRQNSHPETQQIQALLTALASDDPVQVLARKQVQQQIAEWRDNPFSPHAIARLRLTAYQKHVVMKYIDTLISWGDQLFSRDTIESINEATLLYILAAKILGPKPASLPAKEQAPKTYQQLREEGLDAFSNAIIALENDLPADESVPEFTTYIQQLTQSNSKSQFNGKSSAQAAAQLGQLAESLYFCIPQNDQLLAYWDTVSDRLFKIRHCLNIEGVARQLPLFEPPIDPALLVRATAAGVDLGSLLNDLSAPTPHYRFNLMLQKAMDLCNEVKSLGGALLSALEKQDSEHLSNLRAVQELALLEAIKDVKKKQIDEAREAIAALQISREVVAIRREYYSSRDFMSPAEIASTTLKIAAGVASVAGQLPKLAAVKIALLPGIFTGTLGPLPLSFQNVWSSGNAAYSSAMFGDVMMFISSTLSLAAETTATFAGYDRRKEEWDFLATSASKESDQIDKQIAAAMCRLAIVEKELENHELQIAHSTDVEEFLRAKYTNEELYSWMITQLSAVYFQTYKLTYDLAKRAERAYRYELGLQDSSFITFGYWDNLKKGLLAGERLSHDLKRLELAHLDQNRREYEITKQVSLLLHDPLALIRLKQTGQCEVVLPEALFDADYPGHYMRRIKSVSLTIPCVVGPYTSVNCTLTLLSNETRIKSVLVDAYTKAEADDDRFTTNFAALQSIATSHAQNDSGMFELNFRDERYLPFEGAGVIARWRIDLPRNCNAFDFDTISDVVLKLSYTARDGGERLKLAARAALEESIADLQTTRLVRLFSARHEFPSAWHRFLNPADAAAPQALSLDLSRERFPFQFRGKRLTIGKVELFLNLKDGLKPGTEPPQTYTQAYAAGEALMVTLIANGNDTVGENIPLTSDDASLNGTPQVSIDNLEVEVTSGDAARWALAANAAARKDDIVDLWIVCHYTVAS
jgi:hypothetical protein